MWSKRVRSSVSRAGAAQHRLAAPGTALAAEWIDVDGSQYNAGTAAGDDAGTWNWDGANDMQLNGYNGGRIQAGGRLDVT